MKIEIRETTESDIPIISDLYNGRKTVEELNWLLSDPSGKKKYNSFVAVDESDHVVGAIGYILSKYRYNEKEFNGVGFFNWIVDSSHRGLAGIQLLRKVMKMGDFGFAISGSDMGQKVYSALKLEFQFDNYFYFKVREPLKFLKIDRSSFPKNIIKTLYLLPSKRGFNSQKVYSSDIEFEPYKETHELKPILYENVMHKILDRDQIKWILSCPIVESYAFTIILKGIPVGVAICYVNRRKNGINSGRITYLPYLGQDDNHWYEVISKIEQFLIEKKCVHISTTASHPKLIEVLKKFYYIPIKQDPKPFFVRDVKNNLGEVPDDSWYLTFAEKGGDYSGT